MMRFLLTLACVGVSARALPAQQRTELRIPVTPDVYVNVRGAFGTLKVTAWARDTVLVIADLPKGAALDPAGAAQRGTPAKGMKLYVDGGKATGPATGSLELMVPAAATVWAKAANARITVGGVTGGLDLNIVGGSIEVSGAPRQLNIESMDGTVVVAGAPEWLRAKTATGDITIRGSSPDVGLTTVGGNIQLADGTFERVRIESITGNVSFAAMMARAGSLTVDSHSGTIDLMLPVKASMDIEATTIAGTILNSVNTRRPTPGREGRGEELSLGLGIGDARATLRSFKGNIRLTRR